MSDAALAAGTVIPVRPARRPINPWIVAIAVVVPTFMEVLDTTIANVALRQIAGGLSAAVIDSEWVVTSYLAANAVILPISGWIGSQLGRRNYFLLSIAVFTISSMLCGLSTSLGELICFRVLQGLAGGGLQPSSQGVLIDAFPPEKQGSAMTLFGVAALLAPILGPTLGGWLTDNYSWRWIFYINLPVGLIAFTSSYFLLEDPEYMKKARAELKKLPFHFDSIGLGLLVIVMVCWEVGLSKGQEWDWLGDPFYRVQTLVTLFVLGLGGLIFWETRQERPVVNFRPLKERNFAMCCDVLIRGDVGAFFGYGAFHDEDQEYESSADYRKEPETIEVGERRGLLGAQVVERLHGHLQRAHGVAGQLQKGVACLLEECGQRGVERVEEFIQPQEVELLAPLLECLRDGGADASSLIPQEREEADGGGAQSLRDVEVGGHIERGEDH